MNSKFKVICFDMDGTLIRNMNSVEYLCQLCGRGQEIKVIEELENKDEISWIEADYKKAELFKGLELLRIKENFEQYIKVIDNLRFVLDELRVNGLMIILVTAGPIQVAEVLSEYYSFDAVYGSTYEVIDDKFTGRIVKHLGDSGKLERLNDFCTINKISLDEVISIGDSASDLQVFEKSGKSIAINYSEKLIGKADEYIMTEDIKDILQFIMLG